MNVLNILEENRLSGPHRRVLEVVPGLVENDINTKILLPHNMTVSYIEELDSKGVAYITIKLNRVTKEISHLLKYFIGFFPQIKKIRKIISSNAIDLVHVNGALQFKCVIAAKLARAKCVWHLNDTHTPYIFKKIFEFLVSKYVDVVIVASCRTREYYLSGVDFPDERVFLVQAPVDTEKFHCERKSSSFSKRIRVVTVANLNPVKGHEFLLKVAVAIREEFPDLEVEFVVHGRKLDNQATYISSLTGYIDEMKIENVTFVGACDNVPAALKDADIYLCCSKFEASPISVWEACSSGLPIVSTDVGDVAKYNEQYDFGYVSDVDDVKSMVQSLAQLCKSEKQRLFKGSNARRAACEEFGVARCVDAHTLAYTRALDCY